MSTGRNKFLKSEIPYFYQRQTMDMMAFMFIDTYKFVFPSISLDEAAKAFMKKYKISEDFHNVKSVVTTYVRVNKDLIDAQRQKNKAESAST